MAGVNRVILLGNLGKDPEVRSLENGTKVASFTIATSESYKDKNGERQTNTEWHNLVLWRGLADVADKYLKKGNQIYIEGKLRTRSWTDKEDNKRYTTEIVVDNLTMLGGKRDNDDNSGASTSPEKENKVAEPESNPFDTKDAADDLPF